MNSRKIKQVFKKSKQQKLCQQDDLLSPNYVVYIFFTLSLWFSLVFTVLMKKKLHYFIEDFSAHSKTFPFQYVVEYISRSLHFLNTKCEICQTYIGFFLNLYQHTHTLTKHCCLIINETVLPYIRKWIPGY